MLTDSKILNVPKYELKIYWDSDLDCFICEVPELKGCSTMGSSYEEALSKVHSSIKRWLRKAIENSDAIPNPKGRLALKSENICIHCKRIAPSSGRWKPSK